MTVTIVVICRHCSQTEPVRKHGTDKAGFPRYYCKNCQKTFQLSWGQITKAGNVKTDGLRRCRTHL
ncbi:IS1/IS1595 family N-terminal zinc-binding domain-containing protein [Xenorhabdus poinarii]|uniref:IS1/IS1595 family N-terminal zinc-binding domain-containing protein n=1 Tax=Xenorhabdus poinarii TaxID=40577 RepID=UPI003F50D9AF